MFAKLNLELTATVQNAIRKSTDGCNPNEAPEGVEHSLIRNRAMHIWNWEKRLSLLEIAKTRNEVEEVSFKFYSDEDWELNYEIHSQKAI